MKNEIIKEKIFKYILIAVGSALFAAGFQFFLYPNSIIVGGVGGIAMIINMLTGLPVGIMTIVMNIPLFVIAWKHFGTGFIISSAVGMTLSSVFVDAFALLKVSPTQDMLLACFIGGAVKGLGLGLVYYAGATTGGTDILAPAALQKGRKLLRRRIGKKVFVALNELAHDINELNSLELSNDKNDIYLKQIILSCYFFFL